MADSVFGICAKDWAILCSDTTVNRSIFTLKQDEDKITQLNAYKMMACSGEQTDRYQFANYIQRNLALMEYRTGVEPDVESTAQFIRTETAIALRKGPFQVNALIAGYDPILQSAALYWMDYLGTL